MSAHPSTDHAHFDADASTYVGARCPSCAATYFPAVTYCWRCATHATPALLPRHGEVRATTTSHVTPAGFQTPLGLAAVELGGTTVLGHLDRPAHDARWVEVHHRSIPHTERGSVLVPTFVPTDRAPDGHPVGEDAHARSERTGRDPARRNPPPVHIAGTSMTRFGRHTSTLPELAAEAALATVRDAGLPPEIVDVVIVGSAFGGPALGQRMLRHLPWHGRPLINVENACASGATALLEAAAWIESGRARCVLAVGADAVRSAGLLPLPESDPYVAMGVTLPALYALAGDAYRRRTGAPLDAFAEVVVRSRLAAGHNEFARERGAVTREEVLASRPVADPLTLLQCSPSADGAAAALLVNEELAATVDAPVLLASLALRSGRPGRFDADGVVPEVAREAYEQASLRPTDIDVAEIHDAFAPAAVLALEDLGFAARGTAWKRFSDGDHTHSDRGPVVNPSGGLLSRGHPPGATALAQVHEVATQLRGNAGTRQVPHAAAGLIHSRGGSVLELETNACAVAILRRVGD